MQKNQTNEVLDNIDFQQEKKEEMMMETKVIIDFECCPLCNEPFTSSQLVYKLPDNTLAHTKCILEYVDNESREYGDISDERREIRSVEEIF